jgi:L,D-transpeptidase catalytic domain
MATPSAEKNNPADENNLASESKPAGHQDSADFKDRSWLRRAGAGAGGALTGALKDRRWPVRAAICMAGAIVLVGIALALVALLGRPAVSVSSGESLVEVHLDGVGTGMTSIHATSAGRPLALTRVHQSTNFQPVVAVPQGRTVDVHVTAAPPSWLRWLLGNGVSTSATLTAPSAAPSAPVTVAAHPGHVTLGFNRPVSVVDYRVAGQPATKVIRLSPPSATAQVAVPAHQSGGAFQVMAAAWPWEHLATKPTTVDWLKAPQNGVPVAAADPAPGTAHAGLQSPITLTFDEPVAKALGTARPRVSPATAGRWTEPNANTLVFTPRGIGFGPGSPVTISFHRPVTVVGGSAAGSVLLTDAGSYHFAITQASVLRLQQILAQLHYLPLTFTPARGVHSPTTLAGQIAALGSPLKGRFQWRWQSAPASLRAEWQPGSPTVMVKGALMAFLAASDKSYSGYTADDETVNQLVDASWKSLLSAAAAQRMDPAPYSYVHVSESLPETLTLWENGRTVLTAATNTGIPGDPTALGTYPIFARYSFNYMSGFNPDGSYYHDPVYWINYFNGGDAVHGFVRGSYGFPQSLGCVELPISTAHVAFNHLAIGDLVSVVA